MNAKILLLTVLFFNATQIFADARITVSKGNASLCEVVPAKAKKGRHYNKKVTPREASSDLWHRGKNGLGFFHLGKTEVESQTVQLAFVNKYSTFWYYTKNGSDVKGVYAYDFIVPEQKNYERIFVDIELESKMPCSCFLDSDKPSRCNTYGGNHSSGYSKGDTFFDSENGVRWRVITRDNMGNPIAQPF